MKRTLLGLVLFFAFYFQLQAQTKLSEIIVFSGATIHKGTGELIDNGALVIENGKIKFVGNQVDLPADIKDKKIYDLKGKHLYPGLISLYSTIGLNELDAVRASNDFQETGELNTHIRSIIAYNTDSDIIPTVRSNGILYAQVTPRGGLITGNSSVVALSGWSWEEAAYKIDEGMHLNWPSLYPYGSLDDNAKTNYLKERSKNIETLKKLFSDAHAYFKTIPLVKNIRLDGLKGIFDGSKSLYINVNRAKDIVESVKFAKSFGLKKIVLVGAEDCSQVLDFIKENNLSIILYRLHARPSSAEGDIHQMYKLPYLLQSANINFALSYYGEMETAHSRNLAFLAGTAAAYGLSKEQALSTVTINSAKILGIDKTTGSIETGKDATFIVSEGDLLDMRTSIISRAFIKGIEVDLNDKQKDLNRIYTQKYGIK